MANKLNVNLRFVNSKDRVILTVGDKHDLTICELSSSSRSNGICNRLRAAINNASKSEFAVAVSVKESEPATLYIGGAPVVTAWNMNEKCELTVDDLHDAAAAIRFAFDQAGISWVL